MSQSLTYMTVHHDHSPKTSYIEDIKIPNDWELSEGVSLKRSVQRSTTVSLARDRGDMICDFVPNVCMAHIVSERAMQVLQAAGVTGDDIMEYLPFTLLDKRGRTTRTQFYLANPLLKVTCMDRQNSEFLISSVDGEILSVSRLKLHEQLIPPDALLFRLGECPEVVVIRSDLVQRLQEAGLTGLVARAQGEDIY